MRPLIRLVIECGGGLYVLAAFLLLFAVMAATTAYREKTGPLWVGGVQYCKSGTTAQAGACRASGTTMQRNCCPTEINNG